MENMADDEFKTFRLEKFKNITCCKRNNVHFSLVKKTFLNNDRLNRAMQINKNVLAHRSFTFLCDFSFATVL